MMGPVLRTMLAQVGAAALGAGVLLFLGMRGQAWGFLGGLGVALLELLLLLLSAKLLAGRTVGTAALMLPFSLAKFAVLGAAIWGLLVVARLPVLPVVGGFTLGLGLMLIGHLAKRSSRDGDEQEG